MFFFLSTAGIIAHNYFPEAMRLLREDPVASDRLGKPIFNKNINLIDSWNKVQGTNAQVSAKTYTKYMVELCF